MLALAMRITPSAASSTVTPSASGDRRHRLPRQIDTDCDLAAEKVIRVDAAGDQVGVGDGRLGATLAVAGRARHRAGTPGPTLRAPPASIQAMLPPPAPISTISTIGALIG